MDNFENYLRDLTTLLIEEAKEAKLARDGSKDEKDRLFEAGKLLAYHSVISVMQQQAKVFSIRLDAIGLAGIDPEKELV